MQDTIGKVFVIILAVLLLFGFPIMNMYEQQHTTSRQYVLTETTKFVDSIRNIGYITPKMYSEFTEAITATNNIYQIDLEHQHSVYAPVFDDPLNPATYKDEYNLYYEAYFTDEILGRLFPDGREGDKYSLSEGDYIIVKVKNRNKTITTKAKELFYGVNLPVETIYVRYGGMVKNEAD